MTEIDQLKVIKDKENENKKTLQDLKDRLEMEWKKKIEDCNEVYKNTKNEIINQYNSNMEEIKNEENKKLMDVTERERAKAEIMKLNMSRKEIEEYTYKLLMSHIKEWIQCLNQRKWLK